MVHIAFKSAGPALIEMLGGRDEMVFLSSIISATPHVRSGKLRALAVTSARRSRAYPDLPTMQEAGVKGFELNNWYGCFAPRGTPRAIVLALNKVMSEAINAPEMNARLDAEGAEPARPMSPEEFHKALVEEVTKWERFIKSSGFKL